MAELGGRLLKTWCLHYLQTHCNVSHWWSSPLMSVEINTRAQVSSHQFDVALCVQHQVLRLQVSVHDVLLVEVGVGLHHTGSAEHSDGLVKTPSENHRDISGWNTPLQAQLLCIALRHIYYLLPLLLPWYFHFDFAPTALRNWSWFYICHYKWMWVTTFAICLVLLQVLQQANKTFLDNIPLVTTLCILIFCLIWIEQLWLSG